MAEDARHHIGQLLVQTTRHFQTELFRRLNAAGLENLRLPHTHVSAYVKADGSRLTELARAARMTVPAMLELVDDLERLGYAERRPDPSDRRAKLLNLTDKGRDLIQQGNEQRYRWVDQLAGRLSPEESAKVSEALRIMNQAAKELEAESVPQPT